jgi:lipoprotein-releasing system permease protein
MTYIVSMTMLLVAGFGIYNIMSMTVNNKIKDIAILKATGFSGRDIVRIFLWQAVIIGMLGALVGMLLGFIFSYLVSRAPFDGGEFLSIDHFPVNFDPIYYLVGVVFAFITTLFAGYTPAKKASKVDPVAILRG